MTFRGGPDKIAVPRRVPAFGGRRRNSRVNLVRLMAYFIAEGGLTGTCPPALPIPTRRLCDFREIVARHFPDAFSAESGITYTVVRLTGPKARRHSPILSHCGCADLRLDGQAG